MKLLLISIFLGTMTIASGYITPFNRCQFIELISPCECYIFGVPGLLCNDSSIQDVGPLMYNLNNRLPQGQKYFDHLMLMNTNMTTINSTSFSNITFDRFSIWYDNSLKSIDVNAFSGRPLKSLSLVDTPNINPNGSYIFDLIKNLTSLEIFFTANISLTSIPARSFEGLTRLKEISINDRKLTNISENVFYGLPQLELLGLLETPLKRIGPSIFKFSPSNLILYLVFINNLHLNGSSFDSQSLSQMGRPVKIIAGNTPPGSVYEFLNGKWTYLAERGFAGFFAAHPNNSIALPYNMFNCVDSRNTWITRNSSIMTRITHIGDHPVNCAIGRSES